MSARTRSRSCESAYADRSATAGRCFRRRQAAGGLRFVEGGRALTLWNPRSGTHQLLRERVEAGERVFLALEAAETLILTLGLAE